MTDGYHQTTFVLSHQYEIFYAGNSLITSEIMVILWQNQGYWSVASHQNIVGYVVWLFPYGSMENPNAAKRCPNWKSTKYIFILLPHPLTPWHKDPKQVLSVKSSLQHTWKSTDHNNPRVNGDWTTNDTSCAVKAMPAVPYNQNKTLGKPFFHWNLRVKTSCRTPNEYNAYGITQQQQLLRLKVQAWLSLKE